MIIRNNLSANVAANRMNSNALGVRRASEKLASGFRINRAADDSAGLAVSESMRSLIRGLDQGVRNIGDGISLCNVADGALEEVHAILHRLRELTVQSANDTYNNTDRVQIQREVVELKTELDRIFTETDFNGIRLFTGQVNLINDILPFIQQDPAVVVGSTFGLNPVTGDSEIVRIDGGTQAMQTTNVSGETGFHLSDLGTNFPREGVFVVRVGIPGGMLPADLPSIVPPRDVVLDFGLLNGNGDFTIDDFETFFIGTPTGATRNDFEGNSMPVYSGGAFSDLINADELRFDVNRATGEINVRTIGLGGTRAQVGVGITTMTAADWTHYNGLHGTNYTVANVRYANSSLFGATAQNSIGNNANAIPAGFNLDSWLTNPNSLGFGAVFDVGDGVNRPVRVAPITSANESYQPQLNAEAQRLLRQHYMDCPAFWNSLVATQGGTTFSLNMQERVANPNFGSLIRDAVSGNPIVPNRQEPEFLFPAHSATEASNTPWLPTIGDTRYLGHPVDNPAPFHTASYSQSISQLNSNGATTLRNANDVFNNGRLTTYFSSASIGSIQAESLQVDRNGNVLFNWGTTALNPITPPNRTNGAGSPTSSFPSPQYRILVGTAPNGSSYYAPVPTGTPAATTTSGIRTSATGFVSTSPIYPARVSQSGTLEIRIGNSGTSSVLPQTATVNIDFSNPQFSPSSPPDSPAAMQAMVNYINQQLNAPANRPNPLITFRDTDYVNLLASQSTIQGQELNYTDFPVGFAYIDGSGRLAIATAEHNFQINVTEESSDFPMFAIHRNATTGSPSPATLVIRGTPTGTMNQSIQLEPGKYETAAEFVAAHTSPVNLFAPNYSIQAVDNRLVITSIATGAAVDVREMEVTPFLTFGHLLQQFGLVNPECGCISGDPARGPGRFGYPITGFDHDPVDREMPVGYAMGDRDLWIQGRAHAWQGMFIPLPHLSTSVLMLSERRIPPMPDGVGDIPYAGAPDPDDVPRGLNLMTLAGAQAALTTIVHATDIISTARGMIGAATNTLGHMRGNVTTTHENLTASESQIRDADMAAGMIAFTKHNILMQAAQAMLAQANQAPQGILQLLR